MYCLGAISILLGLSKTLGKTGSESLVHQMEGIDWKKRKSIYIDLAPREVTAQLEYLQERLRFEYEVEGKFISPLWYQEQIAAQGMVRFIERAAEEVVKQCEDVFAGETERLISARKYLNATQVIQRGLEACDKSIHHLGVINKAFEGISTLRRVKDIPWPNHPHDELSNRILAVRERLISGFAKSSIELAKMPSKKNWPDYFGQCYSVLAEECNSSMAQQNETLFGERYSLVRRTTVLSPLIMCWMKTRLMSPYSKRVSRDTGACFARGSRQWLATGVSTHRQTRTG